MLNTRAQWCLVPTHTQRKHINPEAVLCAVIQRQRKQHWELDEKPIKILMTTTMKIQMEHLLYVTSLHQYKMYALKTIEWANKE